MIEEKIRKAEEAKAAAIIAQDQDALSAILDEGLIWIHSSGMVDTKAQFQARIKEGRSRYQRIALDDVRVRVFGGLAIITSLTIIESLVDGEARETVNRTTAVWDIGPFDPRLVSSQSTRA